MQGGLLNAFRHLGASMVEIEYGKSDLRVTSEIPDVESMNAFYSRAVKAIRN